MDVFCLLFFQQEVCARDDNMVLFGDEWLPGDSELFAVRHMNSLPNCTASPQAAGLKGLPKVVRLAPHIGAWAGVAVSNFDDCDALYFGGSRK